LSDPAIARFKTRRQLTWMFNRKITPIAQ